MGTGGFNTQIITPRVEEDDSESDDPGPMCKTPLNTKPLWQAVETAFSDNTDMTSPCSSTEEPTSVGSRDFTISFSDKHQVTEVDCDYTDEQVSRLWFTKEEYDDFLQACDEDAQKSEAYEKENRVNKLKKEIKRQRRQRQKEEKRHRTRADHVLDESMHSLAHFEGQEDYTDVSDDDELGDPFFEFNEDQEGWLCSLGLEAWTLDGYKARELHREKAIDSVLNEQYAAWDRGMLENAEMMSALYFAASAITKHEAQKKAIELEKDIQELTVVSTLEDYNRTVQDLNVLQKSLQCIQKQREKKEGKQELPPLAKRRGSTGNTAPSSAPAERRGSTGGMGKASSTGVIEHSTSISDSPVDRAPKQPIKSLSPYPPQTSSSSASRKFQQRNSTQKVYKSRAATDILVSLPTPPVTKKKSVACKPSKGGWPGVDMPLTDDSETKSEELTTPNYRKIIYKPIVGDTPKHDSASRSKASDIITTSTTTTTTKKKKKKKKKKDSSSKSKKDSSERSKRSSSTRRARSESPKKTSTKLSKKTSPTVKTPKGTSRKVRSVSASPNPQRNSTKEHWWFQQQRQALLLKPL